MAWIGSPATGCCLTGAGASDAGAAKYLRNPPRHHDAGDGGSGHRHCRRARDVDARRGHSVLRAVPLTDPVVTRTVGLIRLSGRIQSYVAAELEKLIIEQYPSG